MTTQDDATRSTAMISTRQEKLQALRDDLAPGERPAPIVPRTFAEVYTMCEALAKADLAPKHLRGKAMDMTLVVMTGLEVGLPPMASLRLYTTWDGVPRLMAEGVRALVLQSPAIEYFEVATCDDTHATWVGKRRGRPEKSVTWTVERAKKAGLLAKDTWQKYTQDLLNARASMQLSRLIAPDVVAGMVSREEANDGDFIEASFVEQPKFTAPPPAGKLPEYVVDPKTGVGLVPAPGAAAAAPSTPPPAPAAPAAPAASASGGRSTNSRKNSAPTGSSGDSSNTSKLDAAVKAVEEKLAERPTQSASSSSTSPAASSSPSPFAQASTSSASGSSAMDQTPTSSSSTPTTDRRGQPIADPTSGGGTSVPQSSGAPASETPSAASTPPGSEPDEHGYTRAKRLPDTSLAPAGEWFASDFGADAAPPTAADPADAAVAKILEFEAWLQTCENQRQMSAGFPKWNAWAREMSDKHKDERFRTTGELAIRMKDSWGRRKAQVPA